MNIQVGDFVKIIRSDESYNKYYRFFTDCNLSKDIAAMYVFRKHPPAGSICRVIGIYPHPCIRDGRLVYVVQHIQNGAVYLMDIAGISKRYRKYKSNY